MENKLVFNEENHEYTLNGQKLISVTQLMQKHGLAPNYAGVSTDTLERKAERGTMIHQEIEAYIKRNEIGFTDELLQFIDYAKSTNCDHMESETRVHNDIVAGTIDLIMIQNLQPVIADFKTTYTLHKDAVSWQLSIYCYLWCDANKNAYLKHVAKVFHFKDGLNVVDIQLKPFEEVERLMECERNGEIYQSKELMTTKETEQLLQVEQYISDLEKVLKEAQQQRDTMRQQLLDAMEQHGVNKIDTEKMTITYVAPTTRSTIDSARLKKEQPEVAAQYVKTSNVKASLKITIKE